MSAVQANGDFYARQVYPKRALNCLGCGAQRRSQWDRTVERWYCEYCGSTIVCEDCREPLGSVDAVCRNELCKPDDLELTGEETRRRLHTPTT